MTRMEGVVIGGADSATDEVGATVALEPSTLFVEGADVLLVGGGAMEADEETADEGVKRLGIVDEGFRVGAEGPGNERGVFSLEGGAFSTWLLTSGLLLLRFNRNAARAWASLFCLSHLLTPLSARGDAAAKRAAFFPGEPMCARRD